MNHHQRLTQRELDVLRTILAGHITVGEVAAQLIISPSTARCHLTNIYRKTGVKSRTHLVLMCLDRIERVPALKGYKF